MDADLGRLRHETNQGSKTIGDVLQQVAVQVIVHQSFQDCEFGDCFPLNGQFFCGNRFQNSCQFVPHGPLVGLFEHRPGGRLDVEHRDRQWRRQSDLEAHIPGNDTFVGQCLKYCK